MKPSLSVVVETGRAIKRLPNSVGGRWQGVRPLTARAVGRAMRDARIAADLSIFDVARSIDISAARIRGCELGHDYPSIKMLHAFAVACGVSLREVLP